MPSGVTKKLDLLQGMANAGDGMVFTVQFGPPRRFEHHAARHSAAPDSHGGEFGLKVLEKSLAYSDKS